MAVPIVSFCPSTHSSKKLPFVEVIEIYIPGSRGYHWRRCQIEETEASVFDSAADYLLKHSIVANSMGGLWKTLLES